MYFGEYEYRIDEKGRVPIPPKFRVELKGQSIMLAPGLERCLAVYPYTEWKASCHADHRADYPEQAEKAEPGRFCHCVQHPA